MPDILALALDLLARPSISPHDRGCQTVIAQRLAAIGFEVERMPFGPVENLWAVRGNSGPTVCFAGHTDVVPTGPAEEWHSDPFRPVVRDGLLYGRGAADMKTALAAMVTACEEFVASSPGHAGRIALLITSDEEGPSVDGTRRVVEVLRQRQETIDYCIVGELHRASTTFRRRRGSAGAVPLSEAALSVQGIQGHMAYPGPRTESGARFRQRLPNCRHAVGTMAMSSFSRRRSRFPTSAPARVRRMSFPASSLSASTSASRRPRRWNHYALQ